MTQIASRKRYHTAERRWAGIGPYYAMFPTSFAERVIKHYTSPNDVVLDPFAGRGTAVYAAAMHRRCGLGIEINPVGWVYAKAKLHAASHDEVVARLTELSALAARYSWRAAGLPEFFRRCYSDRVLRFLLAARQNLEWRRSKVDWTLMALLLVHLHGKSTDSFSNQLRQTKAMSPKYAIDWWDERGSDPPIIDPLEFMRAKLRWRYEMGVPDVTSSQVYLGDSVNRLASVEGALPAYSTSKVALLLTSPPYCGVTNYHYDQWIRLWLLGGPSVPTGPVGRHRGKFVDRRKYKQLLTDVFSRAIPLLKRNAVVYVRTDRRELTLDVTIEVLRELFPKKRMFKRPAPRNGRSQTSLFETGTAPRLDEGDMDIILLAPVKASPR